MRLALSCAVLSSFCEAGRIGVSSELGIPEVVFEIMKEQRGVNEVSQTLAN